MAKFFEIGHEMSNLAILSVYPEPTNFRIIHNE